MTLEIRRALMALGLCTSLAGCRPRTEPQPGAPEATAAIVNLTARALQVTGVHSEAAAAASVPETFATTGEIEFDPSRMVTVNAPVSGRVRRLTPSVGDRVAAGDTIATIESPEFLSGTGAAVAPRSGVVTAVSAATQQFVAAGAEMLRIASVDRVWLRVDLYGERAKIARPGVAIEAHIAAFPDRTWKGTIAALAPSIEGATQAVAARVHLDNPDGRLLPGMFANVLVETGESIRGITVPRSAVIEQGGRRLVMVSRDSLYFPSVVVIGPVVGDRVIIQRGVAAGERVVVSGAYELFNAGYAFTRDAEGNDAQ